MWVSEDATVMSGQVQYDPTTNQVVGLVLPLNENSMPLTYFFKATSAKAMEHYFKNYIPVTFLYVYMVQPLDQNATPFCINIFGTDNSMSFIDVCKRWDYMTKLLESFDIKVLGFSLDRDTRLLKSMRVVMKLGKKVDKNSKKSKRKASNLDANVLE